MKIMSSPKSHQRNWHDCPLMFNNFWMKLFLILYEYNPMKCVFLNLLQVLSCIAEGMSHCSSGPELAILHLGFLVYQWLQESYEIREFPYGVLGCSSSQEFLRYITCSYHTEQLYIWDCQNVSMNAREWSVWYGIRPSRKCIVLILKFWRKNWYEVGNHDDNDYGHD